MRKESESCVLLLQDACSLRSSRNSSIDVSHKALITNDYNRFTNYGALRSDSTSTELEPPSAKRSMVFSPAQQQLPLHFPQCWITLRRLEVSDRLRPALKLLQLFGYYPSSLPRKDKLRRTGDSSRRRFFKSGFWRLYSLSILLMNAFIVIHTVKVAIRYNEAFGMLHAFTITSMITGMKPFINLMNMIVYNTNHGRHRHMIRVFNRLDNDFADSFGSKVNIERMNRAFIGAAIVVGVVMFASRVVEFIVTGERLGETMMSDLSLVLVPLISIWGTMPLFYFLIIEHLIICWSRMLKKHMVVNRNVTLGSHLSLKFYYSKFINLCAMQEAAGDLFGPWILCSFGWSVFSLCLSIYFGTQASSFTELPPIFLQILPPEKLIQARQMLYFNIAYSILQIVIAFLYILILCYIGTRVNEGTRQIMKCVLNAATNERDDERFQVTCFMYKMQTQYMWGVTVWRAFPIERSVFFTMVSMIVTYAVLLMKFRDYSPPQGNLEKFMAPPATNVTQMVEMIFNATLAPATST